MSETPARHGSASNARWLSLTAALTVALASNPVQATWTLPKMVIVSYDLVEVTACPGGVGYAFRGRLFNLGPAVPGASARLVGTSNAATVLDDTLVFGPVGHFRAVWSSDTAAICRSGRWLDILTTLRWFIQVGRANQPPVANAGADRTARLGEIAVLDGSGSADPDGDPLTYAWSWESRPAGSAAALNDASAVRPEFTVDVLGVYVLSLAVHDGTQWSQPDLVEVTTANTTPIADAGADATVALGTYVQLDGSGSFDADGDSLTFAWSVVDRPAASQSVLDAAAAVRPTILIDAPGTYVLSLVVFDGRAASPPDTVVLRTDNSPPVAGAGPDQSVLVGQLVTLDGSTSSDVDGDPLTYTWSLPTRPASSAATLQNAASISPAFVADVPGTYVVQLVVNDGEFDSAPDSVIVSTTNSAPTADAGADQTVVAGQTVVLDGQGSSDPDGDALWFRWMLTASPAGSTAALADPSVPVISFVVDRPGDYAVQLVVNDGQADSAPDTVVISTINSAPVADAGPDQADVPLDSPVALDGSGSGDADGHGLTYAWSLIARPAGSAATLDRPASPTPTFSPDVVGDYVAQLIVNDGFVDSAPDTVRVSTVNLPPVADAGPDQRVPVASVVQLDGSASSDPEGSPLRFTWSFASRPTGSGAALSAPSAARPTFVADVPGEYVVELRVGDGVRTSEPDTVLVMADPAAVTVEATDATATEDGDTATFVLRRAGGASAALTVNVSLSGVAVNGVDYVALGPTVTLPSGADSVTVTLVPIDDADLEPREDVTLRLEDGAGYVVGAPSAAVVSIEDNDTLVSVIATDAIATESGGDLGTFTLTRLGSTSTALTVPYTVAGTATAGTDYVALIGTATFPAGAAETTVTVTPIDDALLEGPEDVEMTIDAGPGYVVGALARATLTIQDDERPAVTITVSDATASEAGPDAGAFTVSRTGPTTSPLTVPLLVSGTATEGVDYESLGGSITIPAGAASAAVVITPIDDALIEGAESVVVTLGPGPAYVVVTPGVAGLQIADDDLADVSIEATDPVATEAGPKAAVFTLRRTGTTSAPLAVFLAASGSAIATDYQPIGASVTFQAGEAAVTLEIVPRADNLVEGLEDLTLTISPRLEYVVGTPAAATVTIADDPAVVTIVASDANAAEAGLDPGAFLLTRSGGQLASRLDVSVVIGGTATANRDYQVLSGVASFPAGQATLTIPVVLLPDNVVEDAETVTMTIAPGTGTSYLVGSPSSAEVTISDDPPVVNFVTADPDAAESGADPGTVIVTRTGGDVAAALNVFFTKGGTASNGADYQSLGGGVSLAVVPAAQPSVTVTVVPVADNLVEGPETAVFTLAPNAAYVIGATPTASVTIADDPPVVNVTATDASAAEAGGDPGTFTFTRSGGNLAASLTVSFTRGGSATNVSDFATIPTSVTFPANAASVTLTIVPVDDGTVEGTETVTVTLNASGTVVVGPSATATVSIADND